MNIQPIASKQNLKNLEKIVEQQKNQRAMKNNYQNFLNKLINN